MVSENSKNKQVYIEELGMVMESFGMTRVAGRVLSALLVADPPEQTAEQLAATLQASRGAISNGTTMLETMGLIERRRRPGDRKDYFRNKPNAWFEATKKQVAMITYLRGLAEKGLEVIDSNDPNVTEGLRDMRDMLTFYERELPEMLRRWRAKVDAEKAEREINQETSREEVT